MKKKPQVSCIVPAYNARAFIREAIESILAQGNAALELIVIDDGSVDDTAAIAASFGQDVLLIRQSNAGHAAARNRGLSEASGEFIAFLDADDLWCGKKLHRQLAAFDEAASLEICAGHIQNFRAEMEPVGDPVPGFGTEMLIRRSLIEKLGPFATDHPHASNLEWMLRARDAGAAERLLPDVLTYRRLHSENMSSAQADQSLREHLHVLHASLKRRKTIK